MEQSVEVRVLSHAPKNKNLSFDSGFYFCAWEETVWETVSRGLEEPFEIFVRLRRNKYPKGVQRL